MTTSGPELRGRSTTVQAAHLLLAAFAAVVIAVASQGWPASGPRCDSGSICDGG